MDTPDLTAHTIAGGLLAAAGVTVAAVGTYVVLRELVLWLLRNERTLA